MQITIKLTQLSLFLIISILSLLYLENIIFTATGLEPTNTRQFGQMLQRPFTNEVVMGSSPVAVT